MTSELIPEAAIVYGVDCFSFARSFMLAENPTLETITTGLNNLRSLYCPRLG